MDDTKINIPESDLRWFLKDADKNIPISPPTSFDNIICKVETPTGKRPDFGEFPYGNIETKGEIYLSFPSWMLSPEYFGMDKDEAISLRRRKQFWQKRQKL